MKSLACVVVGEGTAFVVELDERKTVSFLKEAIHEVNKYDPMPPKDLTLYVARKQAHEGDVWVTTDDAVAQEGATPEAVESGGYAKMNPTFRINDYPFPNDDDVVSGDVHVLVVLPRAATAPVARAADGTEAWLARLRAAFSEPDALPAFAVLSSLTSQQSPQVIAPVARPADGTEVWLARLRATFFTPHALPALASLLSLVSQELPEKIVLPSRLLDAIAQLPVAQELLDKLFVVDDRAPCEKFCRNVMPNYMDPLWGGATEASYIFFWDGLVRRPLVEIFPNAYVSRDTNHSTSTALKRPDFVFAWNSVCVFRGEEKDSDASIATPRAELESKLVWSYGDVPYVISYATAGHYCALFALVSADGRTVNSMQIGSFNTADVGERFRFLLALLQLSRLFDGISAMCPDTGRDQYRTIYRSNGVAVHLNPSFVEKVFPFQDGEDDVIDHLVQVYSVMQHHQVPHVDKLITCKPTKRAVVLAPRGRQSKPSTLRELFDAIRCVLEALVALHRASWMHRDLRWSNVMRRLDDPDGDVEWFLIDFVDAAPSPQLVPSGAHLSRSEHAPELFRDGGAHSVAVDVWGVGYLIESCMVEPYWDDLADRTQFKKVLLSKQAAARPTAEEALSELLRLRALYEQAQG